MNASGRYEVVRRIAVGGMAEVFVARARGARGFEKTVVLKQILPELAAQKDFVDLFLEEAHLAALLNHPGIAQIFDFGEFAPGEFFIAMEFVDGVSLRRLIRHLVDSGGRVPLPVAARIIAQVAEALSHAHELSSPESGEPLNIIHRDVSPENILLGRSGAVKLVDFGIARATNRAMRTSADTVRGKLAYMAPEQVLQAPLDRRTDVFALGVVFYELLTGHRPHEAQSQLQLMQAVANTPAPPLTLRRADVPRELEAIVLRALALAPADRHQDCAELQDELERWLFGAGAAVGPGQLSRYFRSIGVMDLAAVAGGKATPGAAPDEVLTTPIGDLPTTNETVLSRAPQRPEPTGPRQPVPAFAGCEGLVRELRQAMRGARGTPPLFVLSGQPGSGKTRLLEEFAVTARREGLLDLVSGHDWGIVPGPAGAGLATLIRARTSVLADDPDDVVLGKLAAAVARGWTDEDPTARALVVEHLAFALGITREGFRSAALDGPARWQEAFRATERLVATSAAGKPWLLAFDGAHLGDDETGAFVRFALDHAWSSPGLVVVTVREGAPVRGGQWAELLQGRSRRLVPPLPTAAVVEAVESVAPSPGARFAQRVATLAQGSPGLMAEALAWARSQGLTGARLADAALPSTGEELGRQRLASMGEAAHSLCQRLAAFGGHLAREALVATWERREPLDVTETALRVAGVITLRRAAVMGSQEYVLAQASAWLAAQETTTAAQQARWAAQVLEWARKSLEKAAMRPDEAEPLIALMARASELTGDAVTASFAWETLGLLQQAAGRSGEATESLLAALAGATGSRWYVVGRLLLEASISAATSARVLESLADRQPGEGPEQRALPQVFRRWHRARRRAIDRWESLDQPAALAGYQVRRAVALSFRASAAESQAAFRRAEEKLRALPAGNVRASLWVAYAQTAHWYCTEIINDVARAEYYAERCIEEAAGGALDAQDQRTLLRMRSARASHLASEEPLAAAEAYLAAAEADSAVEVTLAWNLVGLARHARAEFPEARFAYLRGAELARRSGQLERVAIGVFNAAVVELVLGENAAARQHLAEYLAMSRMVGNHRAEAYGPAALALEAITRGRLDDADALLVSAGALATARGWRYLQTWVQALEGQAALWRFITTAEPGALQRALQVLGAALKPEQTSPLAWTEEYDAGEFFGYLAVATALALGRAEAKQVLASARPRFNNAASLAWLDAVDHLLDSTVDAGWFEATRFRRGARAMATLAQGLAQRFNGRSPPGG